MNKLGELRELMSLREMLLRVFWFVAVLIVWIPACAIADDVFALGADPWRMFWGYFAGSLAIKVANGYWVIMTEPDD